jgi:Zn finger protein HypA/HybF involved in hydrogenase expression
VFPLTITCAACGHAWAALRPFSLYEQQAVESCPCPRCGSYTLNLPEPESEKPPRGKRRKREGFVPFRQAG